MHINRLKIAHIRAPDPAHCLAPSHTESNDTEETQSDNSSANNQDIHVPKKVQTLNNRYGDLIVIS